MLKSIITFLYVIQMILAIDYGTRKIGLALSDETNKFAGTLPVLKVKNDNEGIEGIQMILKNISPITQVVVGLPVGIDFKPTQMSNIVMAFAEKLKSSIDPKINITFTNEVLSTKQAEKGRSRKFKKEKSDSEAARIFLQEYLDHINN
jgi:putative Holliday junction resolvase